jgi:hypothetical protein
MVRRRIQTLTRTLNAASAPEIQFTPKRFTLHRSKEARRSAMRTL